MDEIMLIVVSYILPISPLVIPISLICGGTSTTISNMDNLTAADTEKSTLLKPSGNGVDQRAAMRPLPLPLSGAV